MPAASAAVIALALICAANGLSLELPAHPSLIRLLQRLNAGEEVSARGLAPELQGVARVEDTEVELDAEGLCAVLE